MELVEHSVRLIFAICGGCFAPHPQAGAPCPSGVCPEGLTCSPATQTCELRAVDARVPDMPLVDTGGAIDSRPIELLRQQITNYADTGPSLTATLPAPPTSGRMLVMIGANVSGALTSVTGGGTTWTLATSSTRYANVEIWFGITDGSSATVTITLNGSSSPIWMSVSEWSGLAALDAARSTFGATSPASAGAITTTGPDLLLFAVADSVPNTFGTPTPGTWTAMTGTTGMYTQLEWYRTEMVAGTYVPTVSETAGAWDAAIAAFHIAP